MKQTNNYKYKFLHNKYKQYTTNTIPNLSHLKLNQKTIVTNSTNLPMLLQTPKLKKYPTKVKQTKS
jgi:hypothetical protein